MRCFNISILLVVTLLFNSECLAITTEEFVKQGFIDAGLFLFIGGLCIILIPRLTKLAIIFMLVGDFIVLARIFAGYELIKYIDTTSYVDFIKNLNYSDFRIILFCSLLLSMMLLGFLGYLKNLIWKSFWRLFGFYKEKPLSEGKLAKKKTKEQGNTKSDIKKLDVQQEKKC